MFFWLPHCNVVVQPCNIIHHFQCTKRENKSRKNDETFKFNLLAPRLSLLTSTILSKILKVTFEAESVNYGHTKFSFDNNNCSVVLQHCNVNILGFSFSFQQINQSVFFRKCFNGMLYKEKIASFKMHNLTLKLCVSELWEFESMGVNYLDISELLSHYTYVLLATTCATFWY